MNFAVEIKVPAQRDWIVAAIDCNLVCMPVWHDPAQLNAAYCARLKGLALLVIYIELYCLDSVSVPGFRFR